ncbi:hypothetical protein M406DRAFT_263598 [Cryphonectria parasitica EP155]|uniref:Wax synthase domain-containing protein n=1 Tax=Cryphonectria parasitica (strain ATCC 38755 / EP155) TaxID=660469 RepID=A0A9P5CLK1_CRYP1|nr:uncharacterized protein M406DRAFT_263598 [Cryphonectria parasitica EP155]KAF3762317.1 hypothetical protein M406DRAFT_263598 [Cryphonectria parasitica EP155]
MTVPITTIPPASLVNLGAHVRDLYKQHFAHELAAGTVRPLVIPYSVLGAFILPVLYFSVPHVNRPWLFRARWLVMLFIVAFNLSETAGRSSANFAVGYLVGLLQAWGILWSATLLIWMRPQFEAERVEKRRRKRRRGEEGVEELVVRQESAMTKKSNKENRQAMDAPDEDIARSLAEGYEYYWQAYPADGSFLTRFEWSWDLVTSFRGTGWNWCIPILPRFAKPEKPLCGSLVDLTSLPLRTRQGYRRYTSSREWLRLRLIPMILSYLALDALSVLMMKDPYFIFGPDFEAITITTSTTSSSSLHHRLTLPPILAALPSPILFLYRALLCLPAILITIDLIMTSYQLLSHFVLAPLLGTRAELWHYPCVYGSFTPCVLDKGMAGFWGGWWHQTFRAAFSAPGLWLSRHGYIGDPRSDATGRALAGLLAFAQSGFLHALGSITCLPPSQPWAPPLFFLLCWAGTLVQAAASAALGNWMTTTTTRPRWVRRAGHFMFVLAWLGCAQFLFCDDLARAGVWMLEPVAASPLRALGLGRPGDSWWRWDSTYRPRWVVGEKWWESGIAV